MAQQWLTDEVMVVRRREQVPLSQRSVAINALTAPAFFRRRIPLNTHDA